MDYKNKYLKYKNKYLNLLSGGNSHKQIDLGKFNIGSIVVIEYLNSKELSPIYGCYVITAFINEFNYQLEILHNNKVCDKIIYLNTLGNLEPDSFNKNNFKENNYFKLKIKSYTPSTIL
jgi:hypothetical protein